MKNILKTAVVIYPINGFEDDGKFVEIDGVKYAPDEKDPTKAAVDSKGEKVLFKEAEETPEEKTAREKNDKKGGVEKTLEELAKNNPELQKVLDDKKKLEDEKTKADKDAKEASDAAAEKNGEWQKLAEDRKADVDRVTKELEQKEEILGKYVNSTKAILKDVMVTIPEENRGLIPENFSPREKLEYISKNAKVLGAKVGGKGGGVGKNDSDPVPTEEAKLISDIEELRKKENKTQSDHTKIFELAKKLKEVQAARRAK